MQVSELRDHLLKPHRPPQYKSSKRLESHGFQGVLVKGVIKNEKIYTEKFTICKPFKGNVYFCIIKLNLLLFLNLFEMTKATKAHYIAQLEEHLSWLDIMLDLNTNENHRLSLLAEYRKTAKDLAELRDKPTSD